MSTVFIDVDTQLDFLFPSGALYVPGAERLIPTLAHLTRYAAAARHSAVLSTWPTPIPKTIPNSDAGPSIAWPAPQASTRPTATLLAHVA